MSIMRGVGLALVACLLSGNALAALGRAPHAPMPPTAQAPAAASQLQAVPADSRYTVHQLVLPTGTVVREFATRDGQVFAVHWVGPVQPELADFFGDYFAAYQDAVRQKRAAGSRGGVVQLRQQGLVIVSRGRMGQFEGHAYLPALVPAGVLIDALFQ